jgi:DNA-binding transcriptional LysR family regulator
VSIELLLTESILDFDAHQIDVALRAARTLQDSALVAHKLEEVEGRLFASPSYLAKHGAPRKPEDLTRHRLLLTGTTRGTATIHLRKKGEEKALRMQLRASISASDFSFNREAAVAGAGIAVLPTLVVKRDVDEGALVSVLKEYALFDAGIYLVHPRARFPSPKVQVFRDFMIEAFAARSRRGRGRG